MWPFMLVGGIIATVWAILWNTEVIPSSIQPVSTFAIAQLTFIVAFVVGSLFLAGNNKYVVARTTWYTTQGNIASLARDGAAALNLSAIKKNNNEEDKRFLATYMHISRALPYAFKWFFRNQLKPSLLPIPPHLQCAITNWYAPDKFPALLYLLTESAKRIQESGGYVPASLGRIEAVVDSIQTNFSTVVASRNVVAPPAYRAHYWTVVVLYYIFLMFYLFPFYRWFSIPIAVAIVYVVLGLVRLTTEVANPFLNARASAFLADVNIGEEADATALQSDAAWIRVLDNLGMQMIWKNGCIEKGNRCDKPSDFSPCC